MRKFTKQQVDYICYQIGEWYLEWKNQLVDYDNKQHRLGYAKELLKEKICGEEYYELEDECDQEKEKYITMEKGLQLEPLEKGLVIITDDQTQLVKKYRFYTNDADELEMLASSLTSTLHYFLRKRNMSQEECLSFSENFFKEVKDKYKQTFLEGKINN